MGKVGSKDNSPKVKKGKNTVGSRKLTYRRSRWEVRLSHQRSGWEIRLTHQRSRWEGRWEAGRLLTKGQGGKVGGKQVRPAEAHGVAEGVPAIEDKNWTADKSCQRE